MNFLLELEWNKKCGMKHVSFEVFYWKDSSKSEPRNLGKQFKSSWTRTFFGVAKIGAKFTSNLSAFLSSWEPGKVKVVWETVLPNAISFYNKPTRRWNDQRNDRMSEIFISRQMSPTTPLLDGKWVNDLEPLGPPALGN